MEKFVTEHFGTLFAIFSSIFSAFAGAVLWVARRILDLEKKVLTLTDKTLDNEKAILEIRKQNEILQELMGDIKAMRTDIEWLKKTLAK